VGEIAFKSFPSVKISENNPRMPKEGDQEERYSKCVKTVKMLDIYNFYFFEIGQDTSLDKTSDYLIV